jgi:zinc/manganese transport system substrate-binding protein
MKIKAFALATATALFLSGCAATDSSTEATDESFTGITIVSSTNVWGDIASSIGGDLVQVVSIIDSFSQDPHSYEASARDQLAVNDADLVIANGGGYDSFIDTLAVAAGNSNVVYAYLTEEGEEDDHASEEDDHASEEDDHASEEDDHSTEDGDHDHDHGNEHVWYDFHVVEDFATRLADQLKTLDPENSSEYTANLEQFLVGIASLEERASEVAGSVSGAMVISSEPVADYLLAELGLTNITPESFSQAIEEELDVSPADLLEIQNLISSNSVDLFVVNIQTGSVQIDALIELAEANEVAVIQVSELLPEGLGYLAWMEQNIAAIEAGLK